jgi:hypothetical protein
VNSAATVAASPVSLAVLLNHADPECQITSGNAALPGTSGR